ncbi:MAG TPA: phosphatidylserine/phosphatidylglycerophosphate/cardiolipin synthase family protein [Candidatus Dormibacteraeota bacterium]|nr:phosphatidylserine/phosphatidylglycerophosphate/cardiolipin synthase family protein [Candidatus Dormibacteraeota bacterium]
MLFLLLSLVGCSSPASAASVAPVAAVSEVHLWQDAAIFQLVGRMIGNAHRRVMVEMYELGRAEIVRGLASAKARGVDVRVITDPTVKASRGSAAKLAAAGVMQKAYPVDDARHQIDHVKLLIADGEAGVGGMNWGGHSDRNHDYVLETTESVDVERLVRIFDQDWALASGHPSPLPASGSSVAQTSPHAEIRTMLVAALGQAVHRVLTEVYTLTDAEVIAGLAAAHHRGLDVRVLLDPNQVYNQHAYVVLRAAGVEVRWYPVPRGVLLHAKIGLFDAVLVLGSANWTQSGLGVNHELDIETRDGQAVQAYATRFAADWARSRA